MNIYGDFLIRVMDLDRNRIISKVNLTQRMTHDIAFGPDERIAAAVSDRFLYVFHPLEGTLYHRLKGHAIHFGGKRDSAGTPICTAFFPDGRYVLSGGDDQTICMWDLRSGKRIKRFQAPRGHVEKVLVMPGGRKILSAHSDHYLRVWNIDQEKPLIEIDTSGRVEGFTLTKDGRFVFSCGEDNSIKMWDLKTKERCYVLEGHSNMVSDLALAMNECCLISGSWDGTLGIWFLDWESKFT
jgi:WD40 repeat protein